MLKQFAMLARKLTGSIVYLKRLPADFGGHKIYVTSRADINMLAPGMQRAASDLFMVVRKYVHEGQIVWDIGSNLGILSFSSAIQVGRFGSVYSLEANPRYADIQTRTLKTFTRDAGRVTVLCAAVADKMGLLELVVPKNGHARSHLSVVDGDSAGDIESLQQVVSLTLDFLLDHWPPPDFVKIDIEGAESLAVNGANKLFTDIRPVAYIECAACNSAHLTRFFRDRNYGLYWLDESGLEKPIESFRHNTLVRPS